MSDNSLGKAIDAAANVIHAEAEALARLGEVVRSEAFIIATKILLRCEGTIYIIGLGKSGLVGQKIAATLTSTGAPAAYIHAGDALHGDLGAIRQRDAAILISKSGQTREILEVVPFLKNNNNPTIAITNQPQSPLAAKADVTLPMMVESEGCPLNLAPMTSSTAAMAIGDALAGALIVARDFKPENFARFHPAGRLGFLLTAKVGDLLAPGLNPVSRENVTLRQAVVALVDSRLGGLSIVDENGRLTGVLTDGDLKRIIVDKAQRLDEEVRHFMTRNPVFARPDDSAAAAMEIMENRQTQISILPVVDGHGKPMGILRLHDIIRSAL
ncbi:MAG: KpsF/GutQ family sugar-phosphate isomerase [Nitrospinota bacterium]|nr:KpsF/GutQ family sugar-phosphate isomerase [Nitrospinota bacterium]